MKSYVIDCENCLGRPTECGSCLMAFLDDPQFGSPVRFSEEEKDAVNVMADAGLVPRLRLLAV